MAITAQEAIEGVALDYVLTGLTSNKKDALSVISESNQATTTKKTHMQVVGKDGNILSTVDKYGKVVNDADLAELADRTYGSFQWDFPKEERIVLRISHEDMEKYGISNSTLNRELKTPQAITKFNQLTAPMNIEFDKLLAKVKGKRRLQVREALSNLEAPLYDHQKPMGYAPVDLASNRPDYFNYTNKLAAATLTPSEFALAVDLLASDQKNIMNEEYEIDMAKMVLHAKRITLAETVFDPKSSVDANKGRAGASLDNGENKYVGVYGDNNHPNDWIVLGMFHTIRRLNWGGMYTNGIRIELHPASNRSYGVELVVFMKSIITISTPNSLVKSVTTA